MVYLAKPDMTGRETDSKAPEISAHATDWLWSLVALAILVAIFLG